MTFQQNSAPALSQPPYLTFLPFSSSLRQLTIPTVPLGSPDTIHRLVLAWLPRAASLSRKGRTHSVPKPDISIKFSSAERHDNWEMIIWKGSHFSSYTERSSFKRFHKFKFNAYSFLLYTEERITSKNSVDFWYTMYKYTLILIIIVDFGSHSIFQLTCFLFSLPQTDSVYGIFYFIDEIEHVS